jgi:hypothetical protein
MLIEVIKPETTHHQHIRTVAGRMRQAAVPLILRLFDYDIISCTNAVHMQTNKENETICRAEFLKQAI